MSIKKLITHQYSNNIKTYLSVALIILFSFFAIKPLFATGFFPMHDDTQVARVFEMHKSLKDGMLPVRWVSNLGYGYGYPIFNFYAPLAYYIGAFFMLLGFSALSSTKIMMAIGIIAAGISMYFFAREFWGKIGGIISGLLYVYAPYHALNIYVRGAVAEFWAYAFLPLAFLGVYKVYLGLKSYTDLKLNSKFKIQNSKLQLETKKIIWYWVCITAMSYAGIILSHNLTAMMVSPFVFAFAFFLYFKLRTSVEIYKPYFVLLGLPIGVMLSAFYWLPVPFEMKFTDVLSVVGGGSDYRDHFACISQLWNSPWGFAGSAPGCMDGFSLKIGKLHIVLGILSILALNLLFKKDKSKFQIIALFQIFLIISIFLTLKESRFVWDAIPHMAFFQFPWRLLTLVSFFISFLGGAFLWVLESKKTKNQLYNYARLLLIGFLIMTIVVINSRIFVPQSLLNRKSSDYVSDGELKWRVSKISDEYMPRGFFKPLRAIDVPKRRFESKNNSIKILSTTDKTQQISAVIKNASSTTTLYANLAYFPGWHVYLDGEQVWFRYSGQGFLIDVPKGEHSIDIRYLQTPIEKIGNIISLAGVIVLIIGIIQLRINERKSKKST